MLYNYKCQDCGKYLEVKHGMHEAPRIVCDCGSSRTRKVILKSPNIAVEPSKSVRNVSKPHEIKELLGVKNGA